MTNRNATRQGHSHARCTSLHTSSPNKGPIPAKLLPVVVVEIRITIHVLYAKKISAKAIVPATPNSNCLDFSKSHLNSEHVHHDQTYQGNLSPGFMRMPTYSICTLPLWHLNCSLLGVLSRLSPSLPLFLPKGKHGHRNQVQKHLYTVSKIKKPDKDFNCVVLGKKRRSFGMESIPNEGLR